MQLIIVVHTFADEYDFVTADTVGLTFEGKEQIVLKVCKSGPCGTNPAMWVEAGNTQMITILPHCRYTILENIFVIIYNLSLRYSCQRVDRPILCHLHD